jgi:hypothetical protein
MEGIYFFDLARGKWLETTLIKHSWGEDIADNKVLSPVGVGTAGLGAGYPAPQDLTLVGVAAHTRAGDLSKGIEVRADGATVLLSFALDGTGNFSDMTANTDVAGSASRYLDAFAVAAGASATDLSVDAFFRRRGA